MAWFTALRQVADHLVGNGGAMDNCRAELDTIVAADRVAARLAARVPARPAATSRASA